MQEGPVAAMSCSCLRKVGLFLSCPLARGLLLYVLLARTMGVLNYMKGKKVSVKLFQPFCGWWKKSVETPLG